MGLCKLRASVQADEVLFWGKINGINADYYIALAVTYKDKYEFPEKQFYYTLSNVPDYQFKEMPLHSKDFPEQDKFCDNCDAYFFGEPGKVLDKKEGEEEEAPAEEAPVEEEEENAENEENKKPALDETSEEE